MKAAENRQYYGDNSLSAALYDFFEDGLIAAGKSVCCGDLRFYTELAERHGGPILEIGVGSGRIAWALAKAGLTVVGIDNAAAILARSQEEVVYRWGTRQELRWLFELTGLRVAAFHDRFPDCPADVEREQLWLLQAASCLPDPPP